MNLAVVALALAVAVVAALVWVFLLRKPRAIALDPAKYRAFRLREKIDVSHNTLLFRFALDSPTTRLGLPVGQHMFVWFQDDTKTGCSRPYTPVSSDDELGHFDLVIKVYPNGKMSQHLKQLVVGQTIRAKGPHGHLMYHGQGHFVINRKPVGQAKRVRVDHQVTRINMLAGGTGITPMMQIVRAIEKNPHDTTQVSLIFGNITEDDILLREELEQLTKASERFRVYFTLDKPSPDWVQGKGFITVGMIKEHCFPKSPDTLTLLCGPPPMMVAMEKNLTQLGFDPDADYFIY